jgi:hypothetical protein
LPGHERQATQKAARTVQRLVTSHAQRARTTGRRACAVRNDDAPQSRCRGTVRFLASGFPRPRYVCAPLALDRQNRRHRRNAGTRRRRAIEPFA